MRSTSDKTKKPCLELEKIEDEDFKTETPIDVVNKSKARRRTRSNSASSEASISILERIRQPDYSCLRKVIWCVALLTCTGICLWQLGDRIKYYVQGPTTFQVKVERLQEIQFPAITICPAREPFHDDAWQKALELPNLIEALKADVSVDDIWNEYAVTIRDLSLKASCNETNHCDFLNGVNTNLQATILPTFWGTCVTLFRDSPIEYRGASTYLEILLRPGNYGREWFGRKVAAQYFFHEPQIAYRHDAFLLAELWSEGRDTDIHITLKEFDFLNSSRNPCDSQAAVIACKNKCIDERLDEIINCSLPFMTSKWLPCPTAAEAKLAFDETRDFYYSFNSSDCICRRQCEENLYLANTNTADKRHDNATAIIIQFADNLVERVYEQYAYSFSALVSDIGGSLGIFLGLSILSFLKMFESVVDECKKKK